MFNNIDYSSIQSIYIKPNAPYNPLTINRMTYLFSMKGKGIIDGCYVTVDLNSQNIYLNKGVILVDNTVIKITDNIQFTLSQFENYSSLVTGEYYLIFYYKYDENNPDNYGYLDLILKDNYIYSEDSRYVILKLININVS